jgi:hypothetical protein
MNLYAIAYHDYAEDDPKHRVDNRRELVVTHVWAKSADHAADIMMDELTEGYNLADDDELEARNARVRGISHFVVHEIARDVRGSAGIIKGGSVETFVMATLMGER